MTQIVRLGDTSDHGGKMITATSHFNCNGIRVCVDQDSHSCPIKDHGITPVTATGTFKSAGKIVIRTGDVAGCGAVLISGSPNTSNP